MEKVKIKCPASLSNLVCGYDIFGMALQEPYDILELSISDDQKIKIIHLDDYQLSEEPEKNIAGVVLAALQKDRKLQNGFNVSITKQIKPGSGLGSSAASAAGAIVAANILLNLNLTKQELLHYAMEGEKFASGARHADNIAPIIYGGLTLIRDAATFDVIKIDSPALYITVIHPQVEIKTSYARKILPSQVPLGDAVRQWANTAALVAGFYTNNYDLIGRSMVDLIIEPVRSKLIPYYQEVKSACLETGVLGGGISGSGPSIFMFSTDYATAQKAEQAMINVYSSTGIDYKTYLTTVNNSGITII